MGYRIDYDNGTKHFEVVQDKPWRPWFLTAACFGLFLLLCEWFWPEGRQFVRDLLIPGDDAVTVQAFSNLTEEFRNGGEIKGIIIDFCREVLAGGQASH